MAPVPLSPFEKVKKFLIGIGEYQKFCDIFTIKRSLTEIFSEFWERKDIVKVLNLPELNEELNRKGNLESDQLRSEGNRLYKEKKFDKALLAYNYAILTAPHPKGECNGNEVTDGKDVYQSLSIAFANRSALLYEAGRYEDSIKDIDRAMQYGYPIEKADKLEERKAKCLLHLNKPQAAALKFQELIDKVKSSSPKSTLDLKLLEHLLDQCNATKDNLMNKDTYNEYTHLFFRGPEHPMFIKNGNKNKENINMINGAVKVQHSANRGRHLVATRDIEPGEVLIVERASHSILKLNSKIRSYCCFCKRKAPIVLPCSTCSLVAFCSEDCRNSPKNIHHIECSILPILMTLQIDEEVGLVFRTLLNYTMENIKSELKIIDNKSNTKKNFDSKDAKTLLQFHSNYEALHNLEGNRVHRSGESMVETVTNSIVAVQLLQQVPEFWQLKRKSQPILEQDDENLTLIGAEIMKLIMNFQCNIHCLKELEVEPNENILSSGCYESGYAVYTMFSLMNHSCAPNVLHSNWGITKFMFSISFIAKGEEILDSYGERFVSHDLKTRNQNLKDGYYFDCDCKACMENWPLFNQLPKKYSFKCTYCDSPLSLEFNCKFCQREFQNNKTKEKTGKNKDSFKDYDVREIETQLKNFCKTYEDSFTEINGYKTSFGNVKKIGKFISFLCKYTHLPHMQLIEAQETLLRSFDLMGSYTYLSPLNN